MTNQQAGARAPLVDVWNAATIDQKVDSYFTDVTGQLVSTAAPAGLYIGESGRRLGCEEGYGQVWPVLLLRKGNRWWLSCAPGLQELISPAVAAAWAAGEFDVLVDRLCQLLHAKLDVRAVHHSHQYVPAARPSMHMIPPGYTLRPVTLVDKPANIPQESVLAGTALGVFTPADEVVSWVEATPLPTVTSRHGVMLVGIETREGYRRQGLAKAALAELTRHVIARCNVPLYACAHVNDASQRTALACGYRLYGETLRVQV